jgi:hypothetical protein
MKPYFCIIAAFVVSVSGQQRFRSGRTGAGNGYGAPPGNQAQYEGSETNSQSQSEPQGEDDHQGLDWLLKSVPGQPGTDYPIFAEAPETSFVCDGQVEGGYYADPEADCQAFHVCTTDGLGSLAKYTFLCPNGTIFNQEYFICDWWFNFDCSEAEGLYSLNDDIQAEREAISAAQGNQGSASSPAGSYASPNNGGGGGGQASYDGGRQGRQQGRTGKK